MDWTAIAEQCVSNDVMPFSVFSPPLHQSRGSVCSLTITLIIVHSYLLNVTQMSSPQELVFLYARIIVKYSLQKIMSYRTMPFFNN